MKRLTFPIICLLAIVWLLGLPLRKLYATPIQALYFGTASDPPRIQRVNQDGTGLQTLINHGIGGASLRFLAIDPIGEKMYYSDYNEIISRANLDGQNEEVISPDGRGQDIELDVGSGKLYSAAGHIYRMNLDGSDLEPLILASTVNFESVSLALDLIGERIYFTDTLGNRILRSDLDGSNIETLIQFSMNVDLNDIELDVASGKMYWLDSLTHKIQRANLDGSNVETLLDNVGGKAIALDIDADKLYWSSLTGILRVNFDGSNPELVLPHDGGVWGLDFGPSVPIADPIPEPSTIALLTCGLLGLLGIYIKRRRQAK